MKKPEYHNNYITFGICAFLCLIFPLTVKASDLDSIFYRAEVTATGSGGEHTPFWMTANRQGLGTPNKNYGYVRGEVGKFLNPERKFSWGAAIDIVGGWNVTAPFNIHQLYGEIKYRSLWAMAGSKEFWGEYNNHHLSSGNLLYSGNAMPIPQVRVGTYDFAPFWGTKGWFSVKTYLAFGKFTDKNWQKSWVLPHRDRTSNVLYCSRGLWLRGGNKDKFPLTADIGIEMGTQFGGTIYKDGEIIKMPHKLSDWLKAIIPLQGDKDTPMGERTNVQGNMVGAYNISIGWFPKQDWYVKGYFEHYFEDHSQMTFEYGWKDFQLGLEVKFPSNHFIEKAVIEYVYMKDQTGPVNNDWSPEIPEQVSGRDNYYTHYLYCGWQNWGMGIGTPLAISPIYNVTHILTFLNTRYFGYHIGLEGKPIPSIDWRILLTYTKNWGTYIRPLPEVLDNFSGLAEINFKPSSFKGWFAKLAIGWDSGHLLGNSCGGMITIGKEGFLDLKRKK